MPSLYLLELQTQLYTPGSSKTQQMPALALMMQLVWPAHDDCLSNKVTGFGLKAVTTLL